MKTLVMMLCLFLISVPGRADSLVLLQGQLTPINSADRNFIGGIGLGIESAISNHWSWAFSTRKETLYPYNGYMLSADVIWRLPIHRSFEGRVHVGVDGGLLSHQYDQFVFSQDQGRLQYQHWEIARENISFLALNPSVGCSVAYPLSSHLSIRQDISLHLMSYSSKESKRDAMGTMHITDDRNFIKAIPVFIFSLGYRF